MTSGLSKVFGSQNQNTLLLFSWIGQLDSVCIGVLIPGDGRFLDFLGTILVVHTGSSSLSQDPILKSKCRGLVLASKISSRYSF